MELWIARIPDDDASELFAKGLLCVDPASRDRINKFFRRPDAWRCLLGRLLVCNPLQVRFGSKIVVNTTSAGKPFISNQRPVGGRQLAYNVAHDNALVALALCEEVSPLSAAESTIGVDIMRSALPRGLTPSSFADMLHDQLSPAERLALRAPHPPSSTPSPSSSSPQSSSPSTSSSLSHPTLLQHIYWIWTIKEAYTKSLGLGLGFDFSRISVDLDAISRRLERATELELERERGSDVDLALGEAVKVDGKSLCGFEFTLFEICAPKQDGEELYQGVVARRLPLPLPLSPSSAPSPAHNPVPHEYPQSQAPDLQLQPSRLIIKRRTRITSPFSTDAGSQGEERGSWLKFWSAGTLVSTARPYS